MFGSGLKCIVYYTVYAAWSYLEDWVFSYLHISALTDPEGPNTFVYFEVSLNAYSSNYCGG